MADVDRCLAGLRVLDVSTLFAAPLSAALLADFGADVVKVEPLTGDPMRGAAFPEESAAPGWIIANRSKRSVALDLGAPPGREVLRRLAGAADVIVLNQPEHVLDRWGCGLAELRCLNERAVILHHSTYGLTGPRSRLVGNGTTAEAFVGLTNLCGEADGPPMLSPVPLGDTMSAIVGALGVIAGCYWRDARGGQGQVVELAMFESLLPLVATALAGWDPATPAPHRNGSRIDGIAPRNVYRCADGRWLAVSASIPSQRQRVGDVLIADGVTPAPSDRCELSGEALDAGLASWAARQMSATALAALQAARIPVERVGTFAELHADEHVVERGSVTSAAVQGGALTSVAPVRMHRTPLRPPAPSTSLGADTVEVLRAWLGAATDEINELVDLGAFGPRRRAG